MPRVAIRVQIACVTLWDLAETGETQEPLSGVAMCIGSAGGLAGAGNTKVSLAAGFRGGDGAVHTVAGVRWVLTSGSGTAGGIAHDG